LYSAKKNCYTEDVLSAQRANILLAGHREYESARDHVWLERIRAGLEYRRAMRQIDDRVRRLRMSRDEAIRRAVADSASYREVARALGLSHSRIQQVVNEGRAESEPSAKPG
jgi:DNA invertase Pin-like site-specific DNA recombinase